MGQSQPTMREPICECHLQALCPYAGGNQRRGESIVSLVICNDSFDSWKNLNVSLFCMRFEMIPSFIKILKWFVDISAHALSYGNEKARAVMLPNCHKWHF